MNREDGYGADREDASEQACHTLRRLHAAPLNTGATKFRLVYAYLGAAGAQVETASTKDVTFSIVTGIALLYKALTRTVRSLWVGMANSPTPVSLNVFFPGGGVVGTSACAGAFAVPVSYTHLRAHETGR